MFNVPGMRVYAGTMRQRVTIELPRTAEAPSMARAALEDAIDPARLPDVRLLVTELVTNSVKYGGEGPVRLDVSSTPERIRAEIVDQGAGFTPKVRDDDLEKVGGWGLHLVENLTDRWGTHKGSTHVWFEMDLARSASR
jgi:anti-sigma regulatory factor (Ser/Thr protein kinase)